MWLIQDMPLNGDDSGIRYVVKSNTFVPCGDDLFVWITFDGV